MNNRYCELCHDNSRLNEIFSTKEDSGIIICSECIYRLFNNAIKERERSNAYSRRMRKERNKYWKQRQIENPNIGIGTRQRYRVHKAIIRRSNSAKNVLGADIDKVIRYIESLFQPDMSWENYGEWELDHIKPIASFNLIDEEQLRKCFHYSNIQPLWRKSNLVKNKTI